MTQQPKNEGLLTFYIWPPWSSLVCRGARVGVTNEIERRGSHEKASLVDKTMKCLLPPSCAQCVVDRKCRSQILLPLRTIGAFGFFTAVEGFDRHICHNLGDWGKTGNHTVTCFSVYKNRFFFVIIFSLYIRLLATPNHASVHYYVKAANVKDSWAAHHFGSINPKT